MISDENLAQLRALIEAILDERGIKKQKDKTAAERMRRYRERKAKQEGKRNVTSRSKRNASEGKTVTLRNGSMNGVGTWDAYVAAYEARYGVPPVRNAQVNSMLAKFVQRVPHGEAPEVAAFYVSHNQAFYVRAKHPVSLLLRDAEGLRTEWATGRGVTDAEARQVDATAARGNVWGKLIEESKREH